MAQFYAPVFTGDGRLMALGIAPDQVLLADATTGRELVRLTTLQPIQPHAAGLQPRRHEAGRRHRAEDRIWSGTCGESATSSPRCGWTGTRHRIPRPPRPKPLPDVIPPPRRVRVVGEVLETQARRQAERAAMDRRLAANPDDAEALIHRGWLSLTERRLPEAIADLDHLRRLQPDDPDVDWMLGQAYQDRGNPAGALACSSRVLERAPEDQDTRLERGMLAFALGLTQQAADDFDRVLAADPTRDPARYHRARALNRLGRYREALADLDALITGHPKDFALYQLRGTAHEALGEHEPARLDREKAHSLLPRIRIS